MKQVIIPTLFLVCSLFFAPLVSYAQTTAELLFFERVSLGVFCTFSSAVECTDSTVLARRPQVQTASVFDAVRSDQWTVNNEQNAAGALAVADTGVDSEQPTVNSTDEADSTDVVDSGQSTVDSTDETPATDGTQPVDNL